MDNLPIALAAVQPHARRQGCGTALVRGFAKEAQRREHRRIVLTTGTQILAVAVHGLGFRAAC